jgi:inositol polyphosphate 5-phosphatase INPP5B/F
MLIPGEQPFTINVTITIGKEIAQALNSGREVLEDILVLRLENGRDYFLTVQADYARSCFGMSLDELVTFFEPIRTVPLDPLEKAKKIEVNKNSKGAKALCVPKELWRILDAIYEKGLSTPNLFVEQSVAEDIREIRECLDTGKAFGQYQVHSFCEVLVAFLSSLSLPVIPPHLCPAIEIDSQNIQMLARRLLEELPPIHYNVFVYVISFFREVLSVSDRNLLTATKVARIACTCLLVAGVNESESVVAQKRTNLTLVLLHLLETNSI